MHVCVEAVGVCLKSFLYFSLSRWNCGIAMLTVGVLQELQR